MGFNLKSVLGKNKNAGGADLSQVKTNTASTDTIISQAVTNAGNISNLTLSKEEKKAMLTRKNKVPVTVTLLKYFSLTFLALAIVVGLLLKADLSPKNQYLGKLGMSENTGSGFIKESQIKNDLDLTTQKLKSEISSLEERSAAFDATAKDEKIALLVPEVAEIEKLQKRWFTEVIEVEDPLTGQLKEETKFGLIDSFSDMVEYFEHKDYKPRFFSEKSRNESLGASKVGGSLIMANELEIRGLSINANGANVTVSANELLSHVFTLSSEFVAMMNSYPFYKGATITNFTRRELPEGGDSSEIALRLEFQDERDENDVDPFDQYLTDLTNWQALQ